MTAKSPFLARDLGRAPTSWGPDGDDVDGVDDVGSRQGPRQGHLRPGSWRRNNFLFETWDEILPIFLLVSSELAARVSSTKPPSPVLLVARIARKAPVVLCFAPAAGQRILSFD